MCALMGTITGSGRAFYNDDFLSQAFTTSMLRGEDSSGIVTIDYKNSLFDLHKLPIAGNFFAKDSTAERVIRSANEANTLTIAHVRAATVGKVSYSNAHPFVVTHDDRYLIGAHNGTLQNWKNGKGASSFSVDSEWALWRIAVEGADAFDEFKGAYAMTWWDDRKANILNMARNSERNLAFVFTEGGGMAWASEAGMLYWLLERNKIKMTSKVHELEPDKLYQFPMRAPQDFIKSNLPKVGSYTQTSYTSSYRDNYNTTYRTNNVEAVAAVIQRASGVTTTASTDNVSPLVARSREEGTNAEKLNLLGYTVLFDPLGYHAEGYIEGLGTVQGAEFECIIRADCENFSWVHTWECAVIGAREEEGNIILVLGAPRRTVSALTTLNEED